MDEAGKYTAQHTVMESGIEIRELKHLLHVAEKKIEKLEAEIIKLKAYDNSEGLILNFDEPLHSITSEKHNDFGIQFSDKSQLDADDEEPNKETY